jgi:carbon storage regulator
MLVLTRPLDTWISLEDGRIKIKVVQIKGKQIRLGIVCDKSIRIDRLDKNEVVEDIKPKAKVSSP